MLPNCYKFSGQAQAPVLLTAETCEAVAFLAQNLGQMSDAKTLMIKPKIMPPALRQNLQHWATQAKLRALTLPNGSW